MDEDSASQMFKAFSEGWQQAADRDDFHSALMTGVAAYLTFNEQRNALWTGGSLGLIHVAAGQLMEATDGPTAARPTCSFCGRSEPGLRLASGPNAHICADCVTSFAALLATEK